MSHSNDSYSPTEISTILLDFYQFLTTLHYDARYLKTPPPEGWPGLDPLLEHLARSDKVGEVMKCIPYFDNDCKAYIHYKSRFVDYPTLPKTDYEDVMDWRIDGDNEVWSIRRDTIIGFDDFFPLATGRESWGKHIWLNVRDGEIFVEDNLVQDGEPADMREYLEGLKEVYRTLQILPCRGRITLEAENVSERPESERITEEEVATQEEKWGTDLDVQYIRQLYRDHGWPNAFQRDEAFDAVERLMDKIRDSREEWEVEPEDWNQVHWC
ncbi:hypothetical protein IWW34DRAFT_885205 [Fusarium oxysporum f. sp. albedinis]|nr:hypothetical protein IWW34DRAFT_885205 [Fusarium oxysporum f. sp. albedinis]KAK2471141.1 hypothetical protein H9L39_17372 [Fusarium oxysporum f. sp. albedinis]